MTSFGRTMSWPIGVIVCVPHDDVGGERIPIFEADARHAAGEGALIAAREERGLAGVGDRARSRCALA